MAQIRHILQLLETELLVSIEWSDAVRLQELSRLNEAMRHCAVLKDWTPLVSLNREFHLKIYSLSPSRLIQEEVKRIWTLADMFIATKMANIQARVRTVQEHDRWLEQLTARNMHLCVDTMDQHRSSTSSGLLPERPCVDLSSTLVAP